MQTIKRDIYVTKNVLQAPIEVTEGTNSIAIEFDVRDFDIPASAAAVAYSLSTSSMEEPNKALADVSGNKITIIPSEAFFLPGQNVMQIRIIDGNSKLISFNIIVKCTGKMRFGDEKEEQQSTLVEQMLAKLGEYQKKSASPYNFKGSCLSSELPASGNTINDTYYCTDLKYRKTWNGSAWEQSSLNEADYEDELTKTNGEVSSLKKETVRYKDTIDNIDSAYTNGIYYVNANTANMPFTSAGIIIVMGNGSSFGCQLCVSFADAKTYIRSKTGGVVWNNWVELDSLDYPHPVAYQNTATNVDELLKNGIYYIGVNTENIPFTSAGIIIVMGNSKQFGSQLCVSFADAKTYIRSKTGGVVWSKWVKLDNGIIRWEDKKANFLGDSIVEGKKGNFVNVVANYLSLSKANNYGIGGSRMASSDIDATLTPVCKMYDTIDEEADIIYVAAGTNDYSGQIPLGEENSTDITTFNGALNVTMQGLRNKFPTKLIIFANILSRYTDKNDTLPIKCNEYRMAIKNRCYDNHIIFYDSYKYSGFDFSNGANELTADGLHPNQIGANILGRKISGFINWQ